MEALARLIGRRLSPAADGPAPQAAAGTRAMVYLLRRRAGLEGPDPSRKNLPEEAPVSTRRVLVALFCAALALLAVPGTALAVESSHITTPAGLTYRFEEPPAKITVAGTASVAEVDIRCYFGAEASEYATLKEKVPVVAEAFSVEASASLAAAALAAPSASFGRCPTARNRRCRRRPHRPSKARSWWPRTSSPARATSARPPPASRAASSSNRRAPTALESLLYSASAHTDERLFSVDADLRAFPPINTRSAIQVDGADAYAPVAAGEVEEELEFEAEGESEPFTPLTGQQPLVVTKTFNEATHLMTIHEEDPIVKCSPGGEYPPTFKGKGCTSFVPTGVTLVRTWQTSDEDQVAAMTDTWRSDDHAAHAVNARYYTEMFAAKSGATYLFPGQASFAATKTGESRTLPAGPGAILFKSAAGLPEGGNGESPQGAIVYDSAPSEAVKVTSGSETSGVSVSELPYQRAVPAGGSSTPLAMEFVQGFATYSPAVAITSPGNGSTIATASPTISVAGTASDPVALSSLMVNGSPVSVVGGAWSTSVTLKTGANTITATATDPSGFSKSASVTVTYAPPPPPPPPPPPAPHARQLGTASGAKGQITVTLTCEGTAGTSCTVNLAATTTEKTRNGRLLSISAAVRYKKITVAARKVVIAAGRHLTVTLTLNQTGRRLLARFKHLPVHLTAILQLATHRSTVIAQNITVKPAPKRKH